MANTITGMVNAVEWPLCLSALDPRAAFDHRAAAGTTDLVTRCATPGNVA